MIPFQFNKKSSAEQRKCVEKYSSLLLARANEKKIKEIDDWCRMNLSRSFSTVITASYKELCELKEKLEELDYEGKYSLPNSIKNLASSLMIGQMYSPSLPNTFVKSGISFNLLNKFSI